MMKSPAKNLTRTLAVEISLLEVPEPGVHDPGKDRGKLEPDVATKGRSVAAHQFTYWMHPSVSYTCT